MTQSDLRPDSIRKEILMHLETTLAKFPEVATLNDYYHAVAYTVRDRMLSHYAQKAKLSYQREARTMCYFSAEYLIGPQLGNNLVNLGMYDAVRQAVADLGVDFQKILLQEEEPGLGNGGLGRLAACYLDSAATIGVPTIGYGIRYEFGIFRQAIREGCQEELTDKWLRYGYPWEIPHPEIAFDVGFGGRTEWYTDAGGERRVRWLPDHLVKGVAYDTIVPGYRTGGVAMLRLFKAEATESFDFKSFNVGDYYGAVHEKVVSENISKVLYPNDEPLAGKQLRLQQQYFLASCALQDMVRIFFQRNPDVRGLAQKYAVQLNDTHPAVAVAELMRLLLDIHRLDWEPAWELTSALFSYTNHTLLPEALEKWPVALFSGLLPRHAEIIYEINRRFLEEVGAVFPGDWGRAARLSLIDETGERHVRMAHLACVGSHAVNGVAALHTELLKETVLKDFYEMWPEKFCNVTNGVTPRRFVASANPGLAKLLTSRAGDGWALDMSKLKQLEHLAGDPGFQEEWRAVKRGNKLRLAALIRERTGVSVDPEAMFDVQVKRIHEYKRQHLNVLHVVTQYLRARRGEADGQPPRVVVIGGKAAPGYAMAKLIIRLVTAVADVVNSDPTVRDRLKVVFFPDLNVKSAEWIYPAADLSQQISLAGKEASGTGNMKFSMNGALTVGTLDGANVEIREEVGPENFFLFGLTAAEVAESKRSGYRPGDYLERDPELRDVVEELVSGRFSRSDRDLFRPIADELKFRDEYMLMADFRSYVDCQGEVGRAFQDVERWTRMSILNAARMGKFSSDRAVREYCDRVWKIRPLFDAK